MKVCHPTRRLSLTGIPIITTNPFWGTVHSLDLQKLAEESGFAAQSVIQTMVPSALERAQARTKKFQGGDFGGGGAWFVFGATK